MIKRIFDIITFPFYLIYLFVSFPFKIGKIIIDDKSEKRKNNESVILRKLNESELIEIGQYLFPDCLSDYTTFITSYLRDKKTFLSENIDLLLNYNNFELDKLKPIEVIYIFGDKKQKLILTDWRGEENESEIESLLDDRLQIKTEWKNVKKQRATVDEKKQGDGEFILDLLKTIDEDLKPLNKRLVFFDLGWDAYVYGVVDHTSYESLIEKFGSLFHGTDKLRK